jgi:Glycoside hydrolase family 5 C-terminal domain
VFSFSHLISHGFAQIAPFSLWNYNPTNDDQLGDGWNGENFSWFNPKLARTPSLLHHEQTAPSLDQGGRILGSVVRPYPAKTAGIPLRFEYEMTTGTFVYEWAIPEPNPSSSCDGTPDSSVSHPPVTGHPLLTSQQTEIFVPAMITHGRKLVVRGLQTDDDYVYDIDRQTLFIITGNSQPGMNHKVIVRLDPPLKPAFRVNDFWSDFGLRILAFWVVLLAMAVYWIFA